MKVLLTLKLSLLLALNCGTLTAQGLIFDAAAYDTTPRLPLYGGEKSLQNQAESYSLKAFCPTPDDQGTTNACVAFSCSYGAYTILEAKKKNWSTVVATQNAYSAAYIFNQIGTPSGMSFSAAFAFMANKGLCRAKTFPNQLIFKGIQPPQTAIDEAIKNKMTPPPMPKISATVAEIKSILGQGHPVIFGASVESDFRKLSFSNGIWTPSPKPKLTESHAMLIVGYDDKTQTLDIMNSYGNKWGNNGFIKLKYADLPNVFKAAYILGSSGGKAFNNEGDIDEDTEGSKIDPMQREVVGVFSLKNFIGKAKNTEGGDSLKFEPTRVFYNAEKHEYETNRQDWLVGERFQFKASNIPSGKYLYVFSLDATQKLTVHWPPDARWNETDTRTSVYYAPNFGKNPVSALILSPKTQLTIPSPDEGLQISHKGTDRLVVLISDKPLSDFKERLDKMKNTEGSISVRLQANFGDVLIPSNRLVYRKDALHVQRFVKDTKGSVVAMVLAVSAN